MEYIIGNPSDWEITTYPHHMPYGMVKLNEDEVFISGCNISEDNQWYITVPNMIDGKKVIGIDGGTFCHYHYTYDDMLPINNELLRQIKVSEGIRYIGSSAFEKCIYLEEIAFPSTLKYIGTSCFKECRKLKKIKLPDKIETIPFSAFSSCGSLESVIFPAELKTIEIGAFGMCGLKSVVLNEGVQEIQDMAFSNNDDLKTIVLPRSLTSIGDEVFGLTVYNKELGRSENIHNDKITIYCYPGSYALLYARENGYSVKNADI